MKRLLLLSAVPLLAAPAVLAAPPLSIPIPRPTPEQEEMIRIAEEEAQFLAEAEEAAAFAAVRPADGEPAPAPEAPAAPAAGTAEPPPAPPLPVPPAPEAVPEAPPEAAALPTASSAAEPAPGPADAEAEAEAEEEPEAFRRDPFWPVALVRTRKAEHDARVAARIEGEKRRAAIERARQEAAERGLDVSRISDDELSDLVGEDVLPPVSGPEGPSSFSGATDEEWAAASAKIPARSGYLGGRRPALMLKGDKRPHFEGDSLCTTNHGVVFTWRISKVDFRAYAHELERISAVPLGME